MHVKKIFLEDFFHHQKCPIFQKDFVNSKTHLPDIYYFYLWKAFLWPCLHFQWKSNNTKRRKLWLKEIIRKRHSNLEFCVFIISNWNYLILEMSFNFILFWLQRKTEKYFVVQLVLLMVGIFVILVIFASQLRWYTCSVELTVNCVKHVIEWSLNVQGDLNC